MSREHLILIFRANQKGLLILIPVTFAAWFTGAFAVHYQNVALFSVVSALNMTLGICIFIFHTLGNPKVIDIFVLLQYTATAHV